MKEQEMRLTNMSAASTLERVAVNMAEPGIGENQQLPQATGSVGVAERPGGDPQSPRTEQLRQAWHKALTPEELRNPDTRAVVETAVRFGYTPKKSKEVFVNAQLDDEDRIAKAEDVLGRNLSEEEQKALMLAHKFGEGEIGKEGQAGIYNYTQSQIGEKARILKAAGFSQEERRMLLEAGIAGAAVDRAAFAAFDPAVYAGTPLAAYADQLKSVGEAGGADDDRISGIIDRVTADVGIPPADKTAFITQLVGYKILAEAADAARYAAGRGRGGASAEMSLGTNDVSPLFPELSFDAAHFTNLTLQTIFDEINAQLAAGTGTLITAFIDAKIAQVTPIIQGPGPHDEEEGQRMQTALFRFNDQIQAKRTTQDERQGIYGDIKLDKEQQKKLIELVLKPNGEGNKDIDRLFNKRFGQIDSNPNSDWQSAIGPGGDIEIRDFINALIQTKEDRIAPLGRAITEAEKVTIQIKINELTQLKELREKLHTVSYAINSNLGIPELRKFLKYFKAEYQDIAFGLKGVPKIMHLYEDAMHQVATENGGYIKYEDMVNTVKGEPSKVEQIVRDQVARAKAMKMPVFKDMEEYEVLRAISVARGMGIAMGNFFEIIAEKGMSKGVPLTSWWANPIIKRMAPFRQMMRFKQGGKNLTMLAFNLDEDKKGVETPFGKVWTISEQKELIESGLGKLLTTAIGSNKNVSRYVQALNPLDIGSRWSQTLWRVAQDEEHFTSAMSGLLEHNLINPLIGTGLWIEKQKGYLKSKKKLGKVVPVPTGMIQAVNRGDFRDSNNVLVHFTEETTEGDLAKLLIEQNLRLSVNITPLTLFNSLTELRYAVLRNNYAGEIIDTDPVRDPERNGDPSVREGSDLQKDMNMLALLQEKLLDTRLNAYETWRDGGRPGVVPNLYREHADIKRIIEEEFLEGHLPGAIVQRNRLLRLVENIQRAFTTVHAGEKKSPFEELMEDLKEKKWKVPYILGHDMPYDRIQFIKEGPDSVDRRGDDWEIVDATVPLINKYIENLSAVHKKEDLIAGLTEIHRTLAGHDRSAADELVKNLVEGTIFWFRKDIRAMLPASFGTVWGMRGDSSLAQVLGGREKMAWDRTEMNEFVYLVHGAGIVDTVSEGQIEEIRKHTGSTKELAYFGFGGAAQTAISFMAIAYMLYMMSKLTEEK